MKPLLIAVTVCSILVSVFAPPQLKIIALFLLFCVPGFVITSFLSPQRDVVDQIILSIVTGLAFQIVYAYLLSLAFHFSYLTLFLPSLCLAAIFDLKSTLKLKIDKKAFLIFVPALLFGIATFHVVPGEDANFHLLTIGDIIETRAVPHTYILYPEIPEIMYPLGFHILTAQIELFSGVTRFTFTFATFLSILLCLSVYFCTKKLFSTECGLLAGTFSVFATFPPLDSLVFSTYANLLAYIFACAAIGITASVRSTQNSTGDDANVRPTLHQLILLSLILAAGVETHLTFFLIVVPISVFLVMKLRRTLTFLSTLVLSVVLSLPFLLRVSAGYNLYEVGRFLTLWYDPLILTPQMIPQRIGIWIPVMSVLGLFFLSKHRVLFLTWIGVFLFLGLNTVLRIKFPLWYVFFATRMVDQLFIPFSILAAFFLTQVWKLSKIGVLLLCGILLVSGSSHQFDVHRTDEGILFPTVASLFNTDQEGMVWLSTTDRDTVILNEWWTSTGSAWIPSLARRRVIFPYIFSLEHYTEVLHIPENERKSFVIAAFPDSEEAYTYLKEWGVDYIFLSSYVLEDARWRSDLWNPSVLESPNYTVVFHKKYTYIFRVAPRFEYSNTFSFREDSFTVTDSRVLDVSLGNTSFPVTRVLDLRFEDTGWSDIEIKAGERTLAIIPRTNTMSTVHTAFRIPGKMNEVTFHVKEPLKVTASVSAAFRDSIPLDSVFLVGNWKKTSQGYELGEQGHIYLFNTRDAVELTYVDTGEKNIDFNVLIDEKWEKLATIYRENDGKTKTILLHLPEGYSVLDVGVKNWGDPFVVISVQNVVSPTSMI